MAVFKREAEEIENGRKRYQIGYSTQRHREQIMSIKGMSWQFLRRSEMILKSSTERASIGLPLWDPICSVMNQHLLTTICKQTFYVHFVYVHSPKRMGEQRVHWKTLRETSTGVFAVFLNFDRALTLRTVRSRSLLNLETTESRQEVTTPIGIGRSPDQTAIDPLIEEAKKKRPKQLIPMRVQR